MLSKNFLLHYQIQELEQEKRDLERNVNELKAKCEQIEKRAQEQKQVEEKKHQEEIQFLKRTNQQLKVGFLSEDMSIVYFLIPGYQTCVSFDTDILCNTYSGYV